MGDSRACAGLADWTGLNRTGVVWSKADTRVKLWLPPSEFQGTGALRATPQTVAGILSRLANNKKTFGQPFSGRLSAGWMAKPGAGPAALLPYELLHMVYQY